MKKPGEALITRVEEYSKDLRSFIQKIAEAQILNRDEKFTKDVRALRHRWKIPPNGFKNKKRCQNWFADPPRQIIRRSKIVHQIEREIITMGKRGRIVIEAEPKIIEGRKQARNTVRFPIPAFLTAVNRFMVKNKIDETITQHFLHFLYYDKLDNNFRPKSIVEVSERITLTKSRRKISHLLSLAIGPNTRQQDITNIWVSQIEPLQEKLPGYEEHPKRNKTISVNLSSQGSA